MKVTESTAKKLVMENVEALDPITVFLEDYGNGVGRVTVVCWGTAWTAFFGSMCSSLEEFLSSVHAEYLSGKLVPSDGPRPRKSDTIYRLRVAKAVVDGLRGRVK